MYLRFSNIVRVIIVELWIILEFPFIGGFWRPVSLIHQLEGHLFYSHLFFFFLLQWIRMLWTFTHRSTWGHLSSLLLGRYLGVSFLGHCGILCLTFEKLPNCFSKWLHPFTFPPAIYEWPCSSVSSPTLVIVCLFFFKFYLISYVWVICLHVCLCTMCPQYLKEDIRSPIIGVVDGYELPCGCRELKLFWKSNQCY